MRCAVLLAVGCAMLSWSASLFAQSVSLGAGWGPDSSMVVPLVGSADSGYYWNSPAIDNTPDFQGVNDDIALYPESSGGWLFVADDYWSSLGPSGDGVRIQGVLPWDGAAGDLDAVVGAALSAGSLGVLDEWTGSAVSVGSGFVGSVPETSSGVALAVAAPFLLGRWRRRGVRSSAAC